MFYVLEVTTTDKVSKAVYEYATLNEAKANFHSKLGSQMKSSYCNAELVMVIDDYGAGYAIERYTKAPEPEVDE